MSWTSPPRGTKEGKANEPLNDTCSVKGQWRSGLIQHADLCSHVDSTRRSPLLILLHVVQSTGQQVESTGKHRWINRPTGRTCCSNRRACVPDLLISHTINVVCETLFSAFPAACGAVLSTVFPHAFIWFCIRYFPSENETNEHQVAKQKTKDFKIGDSQGEARSHKNDNHSSSQHSEMHYKGNESGPILCQRPHTQSRVFCVCRREPQNTASECTAQPIHPHTDWHFWMTSIIIQMIATWTFLMVTWEFWTLEE